MRFLYLNWKIAVWKVGFKHLQKETTMNKTTELKSHQEKCSTLTLRKMLTHSSGMGVAFMGVPLLSGCVMGTPMTNTVRACGWYVSRRCAQKRKASDNKRAFETFDTVLKKFSGSRRTGL